MDDRQSVQEHSTAIERFYEIEIEKSYDAIASLTTARLQVGVLIATVNMAALGVAVTTGKVAVILFATVLPLILVAIDTKLRVHLTCRYLRLFELQGLFAPQDRRFALSFPGNNAARARRALDDWMAQPPTVGQGPGIPIASYLGLWLPLAATLVQIVLGLLLWRGLGWPLL